MSETIILERKNIIKPISEYAKIIKNETSNELVFEKETIINNATVILMCFEQYYFRVGSYVSITIQLIETTNKQEITLIGHGGGDGLCNFSWGANSSIVKKVEKILKNNGF